jgi:hypothetical protein
VKKAIALGVIFLTGWTCINAQNNKPEVQAGASLGMGYTGYNANWHTGGILFNGKNYDEISYKRDGLSYNVALTLLLSFKKFKVGPVMGYRKFNIDSLASDGITSFQTVAHQNVKFYGIAFQYDVAGFGKTRMSPIVQLGSFNFNTGNSFSREHFKNKLFGIIGLSFEREFNRFTIHYNLSYGALLADYVLQSKLYDYTINGLNLDIGVRYRISLKRREVN